MLQEVWIGPVLRGNINETVARWRRKKRAAAINNSYVKVKGEGMTVKGKIKIGNPFSSRREELSR
jgi:hypothetical protein